MWDMLSPPERDKNQKPQPSPLGLIFTHIFGWTRGVHGFTPKGAK
jgi:hypothetical protein